MRKSGDRSEEASPWIWKSDSMIGSLLKGEFWRVMKVSEEQTCDMNLPSLLYTNRARPWKPLAVKKRDLRWSQATARLSAVRREVYGCS